MWHGVLRARMSTASFAHCLSLCLSAQNYLIYIIKKLVKIVLIPLRIPGKIETFSIGRIAHKPITRHWYLSTVISLICLIFIHSFIPSFVYISPYSRKDFLWWAQFTMNFQVPEGMEKWWGAYGSFGWEVISRREVKGIKSDLKRREAPHPPLTPFTMVPGLALIVKRAHWHSVGNTKWIWHKLAINILNVGPHGHMKCYPWFHVDIFQKMNTVQQYW